MSLQESDLRQREVEDVLRQAHYEIRQEERRAQIEAVKARLRKGRWWHRLFPFTVHIVINWRNKHV